MNNTSHDHHELHVIFGSGPLGKNTARALVRMGKRVRLVNRSGRAADLPEGVEVVAADAYNRSSAQAVARGAAAVYQCAQPEYNAWAEKFPALQTSILEAAAASGAKLIVGDNLYMYGSPNGKPIDERAPYAPVSKKGRVRAAMAEAVMAAHRSGKVRAAIGRASNFVGPEYDILGDLVFWPALQGKTVNLFGDMHAPHSFTYIPDFGCGLAVLGTRDEALGGEWIVPTLAPISQQQLLDLICAEVGRPVKVRTAGRLLMRLFGLFNVGARETVEQMYEFEKPFVVDSSKFERAFGMTATPLPEVMRTTVEWYRTHLPTE